MGQKPGLTKSAWWRWDEQQSSLHWENWPADLFSEVCIEPATVGSGTPRSDLSWPAFSPNRPNLAMKGSSSCLGNIQGAEFCMELQLLPLERKLKTNADHKIWCCAYSVAGTKLPAYRIHLCRHSSPPMWLDSYFHPSYVNTSKAPWKPCRGIIQQLCVNILRIVVLVWGLLNNGPRTSAL